MYYSKIYIWYTGELTLYQGRPQCSVAGYSLGQKRERMAIKDAVVEEKNNNSDMWLNPGTYGQHESDLDCLCLG